MGARQSKRSVDISNPPKKGELENGVEEGGKLERLEEGDVNVLKATQNGNTPHAEKEASSPVTEEAAPVVNGETEKETEKEKAETKEECEEKKDESLVNGAADSAEVTSPEKSTDEAAAPDTDKKKKKEKSKKKWSFRSISFSRKDKSKPNMTKDESKNGNVTKEEPVAEVVEAEAAANTEALPVKDDEPKKEEAVERTEEEKKEEKPVEPAPAPVATPAPEPAVETSHQPPVTPAPVTPAPVAPEPTPEPEPVVTPAPAQPETPAPAPVSAPIVEPEVVEIKAEAKSEELPPPLPASPPPTEAPPPTPVAPTPAPVEMETPPAEADTQETEVVGGGGESMAEPEDVEPVLDSEDKPEDLPAPPLINGFNHDDEHQIEELSEKVEIVVTENLKTIVTESIISTQENSEDQSEQTASAAE